MNLNETAERHKSVPLQDRKTALFRHFSKIGAVSGVKQLFLIMKKR
ncbi:hypothetical protein HMPREF0556_11133 [Listeria grayi DSM 20601]|uniref:Uncharacterized protein n=1 Tax=Listeria grayi DSM 20601 TaxID=525367 RepID=D7UY22_LISGR|nr:hypothetical protein HMPREF0556_11133 [Listeria grayi DSM 20601]